MLYIFLTIQAVLELLIAIIFVICVAAIMIFVKEQYENCRRKKRDRKWQKDYEELLQQKRRTNLEWKLRREEMEKQRKEKERYPLFFLKEGIV